MLAKSLHDMHMLGITCICASFLQPGRLLWLHMHELNFMLKSWAGFLAFMPSAVYAWHLPKASQPQLWAACCWRSVAVQITSKLPCMLQLQCLCFKLPTLYSTCKLSSYVKCINLNFTVYGHKQTNRQTYKYICNAVPLPVPLVWGLLSLAPISRWHYTYRSADRDVSTCNEVCSSREDGGDYF